jgi:ABC-type multidrug transport system fused ATPase/permease subunit
MTTNTTDATTTTTTTTTSDNNNYNDNDNDGNHRRLLKGETATLPQTNERDDGWLARLFVGAAYPLIAAGFRGRLQQRSLRMPRAQATEEATSLFERHWADELALLSSSPSPPPPQDGRRHQGRRRSSPPRPSLLRALRRSFGWNFAAAGAFKLCWSGLVILGASYFVNALVEFVQRRPGWDALPAGGVGWVLSAAFFADAALSGIALQRMGDTCVRLGIRVRAALMASVYRKAFRVADVSGEGDGGGGGDEGEGEGEGARGASGGNNDNINPGDDDNNSNPLPPAAAGGSVVSLVSTDCAKVYEGIQHVHNVWTAPVEAATIIALLLWRTGGAYGLPALGVVLVVLPLQYYLGYRIARYKSAAVEISDARVLRMHEVLLAIKLVKFYAWERPFARQVEAVRAQEVRLLRACNRIKTLNLALVFFVPPVIALVIYATYGYTVGPLTPAMAFVVLSLFNTLRFPLVVLPKALRGTSEAAAALARLEQFLLLPEVAAAELGERAGIEICGAELTHGGHGGNGGGGAKGGAGGGGGEGGGGEGGGGGNGGSGEAGGAFVLTVPEFEVRPGQVVAIVGRVGAGKSSVLQAALGRMRLLPGGGGVVGRGGGDPDSTTPTTPTPNTTTPFLRVGGRVAYVPQTPWVQNLSVRDNILFGLPFDEQKYRRVIHACALELDLEILPEGDSSAAGERGINLSGGQRQRVCLARAAYHGADVVLLDNPLSAVDQHTSKHIFEHCIKGLLKEKAVVLVAHQLELLPLCDAVAVVADGRVAYFGPPSDEALRKHMPPDDDDDDGEGGLGGGKKAAAKRRLALQLQAATVERKQRGVVVAVAAVEEEKEDATAVTQAPAGSAGGGSDGSSAQASSSGSSHIPAEHGHNNSSHHNPPSSTRPPTPPLPAPETADEVASKFSGRCRRLGAQPAALVYLRAGGPLFFAASLLVFALTQSARIIGDWWIRAWAADSPAHFYLRVPGAVPLSSSSSSAAPDLSAADPQGVLSATRLYLAVYAGLVLAFLSLLLLRDTVFSSWAVRAATRMHTSLFRATLQAPVLFFLRTPVGEVLNAFARDQVVLDETLPDTAHMTLIYACILLTSLGIVTAYLHLYAVMIAALFLSFFAVLRLYLPAATTMKRWAGETASAVFVHVDETLQGMDVVRAFGCVDHFVQENVERINRHGLALFGTEQCHLWLAFWCDLLGAVLVVATCLLAVGFADQLGAASVGLAISNSIQVLVFFTWVVRGVADVVSMWDAVEKVASYATQVPSEVSPGEALEEERAEKAAAARAAAAERELRAQLAATYSGFDDFGGGGGGGGGGLWLRLRRGRGGGGQEQMPQQQQQPFGGGVVAVVGRGKNNNNARAEASAVSGLGSALFSGLSVIEGAGRGSRVGSVHGLWGSRPGSVFTSAASAMGAASGQGGGGGGGGGSGGHHHHPHHLHHRTTRATRRTSDIEDAVMTVRRIVSLGNGSAGAAAAAAAAVGAPVATLLNSHGSGLLLPSSGGGHHGAGSLMTGAGAGRGGMGGALPVSAAEILALSVQHKLQADAQAAAAAAASEVRIFVGADGGTRGGGGGDDGDDGDDDDDDSGGGHQALPPTTPLTPSQLAAWPRNGDVRFDRVCLRYFPGGPLVLKNVSFRIRSGEKVGVVGRTGSGKTTLLMALFRMLDLAGGRVLLGGVDASRAPLRELRRRVAIIPQEPVMFKGTVRSNLDPFGVSSDQELWHCLSLVHLKHSVAEMPGGLDAPVAEAGANFSLGRRQLVCMARCVLRKTRLLVLDEATAAMDLHTDALVQRTVRRAFADRTTLTIAHRLDTIIHSTRVLAMARGEVIEFDAPLKLLQDEGSMFSKLVEDTGEVASAQLRRMAREGPKDDVVE